MLVGLAVVAVGFAPGAVVLVAVAVLDSGIALLAVGTCSVVAVAAVAAVDVVVPVFAVAVEEIESSR